LIFNKLIWSDITAVEIGLVDKVKSHQFYGLEKILAAQIGINRLSEERSDEDSLSKISLLAPIVT
jgi:hypothetical protein